MSGHSPDEPSGSGSVLPTSKAIGSLAKKQADITRQGTQKLKFVPTLPVRRKKEEAVVAPAAPARSPAVSERVRGRGRGDGSGRGRGRGSLRPESEMTASGPFAMGPALAGNTARRSVPRSNFAPIMPFTKPGSSTAASFTHTSAPALKKEVDSNMKQEKVENLGHEEVYSDPDEGVEIVDMEDVRQMDWMAPESLRKERLVRKIKKENIVDGAAIGEINRTNALDLSDSEEEEELEDIIQDFAAKTDIEMNSALREERLYFFQFPRPFPIFNQESASPSTDNPAALNETWQNPVSNKAEQTPSKDVESSKERGSPHHPIDGIIGQLEIYRSGVVKMRLANGILLDVNAATQPSFLQQAVYLDETNKQLIVLGEVNKRFSISPNVEALLAAMEAADREPSSTLDSENLIRMDTT